MFLYKYIKNRNNHLKHILISRIVKLGEEEYT